MKRLLVSMDDERYEDLRRFAFERRYPWRNWSGMQSKRSEDQIDGVAIQRGLEEHAKDPSGTVTIEELMEQMGIELPRRNRSKRAAQHAGCQLSTASASRGRS